MATIGAGALTLTDIVKATDPKGKPAKIVEILTQANEMLGMIPWIPCNDGQSHQTTIRTGLPTGTWRRYNEGVAPTKGTTAQVRVQTGSLESVSVVDKRLAEKGGKQNVGATRAREAVAHIEGLSQQMATALIYEDERTNVARLTGLAPHYSSVLTATAASAENVIDGGGTGSDNTSIWLVGFGENAIHGVFEEGGTAGLHNEDDGEVDVIDATGIAGASFRAYRERFRWQAGLCVADWTKAGRICNIDTSNLDAESSDADLVKLMIRLSERVQRGGGRYAWLMNRKARTWLRIQKLEKAASQITYDMVEGKKVMFFDEVPVLLCDAILNSEARIV